MVSTEPFLDVEYNQLEFFPGPLPKAAPPLLR
jgi:hypothetical protein